MTDAISTLAGLSEHDRTDVLSAASAVDIAVKPVDPEQFRALRDPALRRAVEEALQLEGRDLIGVDGGWTSGYTDDIADRLLEQGLGALSRVDRAVLTLVLLHTVAIPRARGRIDADDWSTAVPTSVDELEGKHVDPYAALASCRVTLCPRRSSWATRRRVCRWGSRRA